MKLYAKSIGRVRSIKQNKKVLLRREISNDSVGYTELRPSCYQRAQYTNQPDDDLDEADSLAFLYELFKGK